MTEQVHLDALIAGARKRAILIRALNDKEAEK